MNWWHIHRWRKTGKRSATSLTGGQFREFGPTPVDVEYRCRCGAVKTRRFKYDRP